MPRRRRRSEVVATHAAGKKPETPMDYLSNQHVVYGLIVVFLLLYFATGIWMFGLLIGLCIVWVVVLEFAQGAKEHGLKDEVKETFIALLLEPFMPETAKTIQTLIKENKMPDKPLFARKD